MTTPVRAPFMLDDAEVAEAPGCEPGFSGFESRRSPHFVSERSEARNLVVPVDPVNNAIGREDGHRSG